jgi:hypothetical protein
MSKRAEKYFKARITDAIDDSIRQLEIELQVDRSEAGRELMRRGARIHVTPVMVRPHHSSQAGMPTPHGVLEAALVPERG